MVVLHLRGITARIDGVSGAQVYVMERPVYEPDSNAQAWLKSTIIRTKPVLEMTKKEYETR